MTTQAQVDHYAAMAAQAALPQIAWEVAEARTAILDGGDLGLIVAHLELALELLGSRPPREGECRDLVWERLPDGTFTWLRADLTVKREPMCLACNRPQSSPSCATREHWG